MKKPIVNMIWLGPPLPQRYRKNIQSYIDNGYEVKLWTKPPKMHNKQLFDKVKTPAIKADIMRLEILYQNGGIYTDVDSFMNKELPILSDLMCTTSLSGYCENSTLYATQGHPALKNAIQNVLKHYDAINDEIYVWEIAGATFIDPIFSKYEHYKFTKDEVGSLHRKPIYIAHSFDGTWSSGNKSEKRKKEDW